MLAKPAKVPSLGARSGGVGSLASAGLCRARVSACAGRAASSAPDTSLRRSGAVSAARSRSIPHLNLSQPLGSSAAQAGAAPSSASATRSEMRMSVDRNHDVGSFHHDSRLAAGLDAEVVDRLVGDGGGDDLAASDIDADMRRGCALLHFDDCTLDLVACTDAHGGPHNVSRTRACRALLASVFNRNFGPSSVSCRALTALRYRMLAHFVAARKAHR